MKKLFTLIAVIVMGFSVITASADVLTEHVAFWGISYTKAGTAYLANPEQPGYILLSISSSPQASIDLLGALDWFCSAADFLNISDFVPGCSFVNAGKVFNRYVDKGITVAVQYSDPTTGEEIWHGVLSDGAIMELGADHPGGYRMRYRTDLNSD